MKEVRFLLQSRLVTHGIASLGQLMRAAETRPQVEEARPALPARVAPRIRNDQHLVLRSHLLVAKVS